MVQYHARMSSTMLANAPFLSKTLRSSRRLKVKSGCRTCKTRRVKCDEGFPECGRCSSSGRICGGYGVWGGGSSVTRQKGDCCHVVGRGPAKTLLPGCLASMGLEAGDRDLFAYFQDRAVSKLISTVSREFWRDIVMPAAQDEACLMHATLAFSSLHRSGTRTGHATTQGHAAVHHYLKAIQRLRDQKFANGHASSIRTAFIASVVFFAVDFFGAHFQSAIVHGQNAVKLLLQYQGINPVTTSINTLRPPRTSSEEWMIEVAVVLQTQMVLQNSLLSIPLIQSSETTTIPASFGSVKEAWCRLQAIIANIFQLSHNVRVQEQNPIPFLSPKAEQEGIQSSLDDWAVAVEASKAIQHECERDLEWRKYYTIVRGYHIQALVMLARCLDTTKDDEMAYDTYHIAHFEALIGRMAGLCRISRSQVQTLKPQASLRLTIKRPRNHEHYDHSSVTNSSSDRTTPAKSPSSEAAPSSSSSPPSSMYSYPCRTDIASTALHNRSSTITTTRITSVQPKPVDLNHSLLDLGWIPLLFFLATRCRVHRIRTQAARLLILSTHREGIWDSHFAALAANKVIELEEGEFYIKGLGSGYDPEPSGYELFELPTKYDLALPRIGKERRLRGVEMRVEGEPVERVVVVADHPLPSHLQGIPRKRGLYGMSGGAWEKTCGGWAYEKVIVAIYEISSGTWS